MLIRTTAYLSDMKTPVARLYQPNESEWVEAIIDVLGLELSRELGQWVYSQRVTAGDLEELMRRLSQWTGLITDEDLVDADEANEPIPMLDELIFVHEITSAVEEGEDLYVVSTTFEEDKWV